MKKLIIILFIGCCIVSIESCLQKYLDVAPQAGLTEQDVFTKYENTKSFLDGMYKGQNNTIKIWHYIWFQFWGHKYGWDALTDMSDQGRMGNSLQIIKAGNLASTLFRFEALADARDMLHSPYINIRKCNLILANIKKIKDASQEDLDDLAAQAYFIRAYGHMTFDRLLGGNALYYQSYRT
jgi:starch-binding outer membrane protein, SusD/RagB family